MYTFIVVMPADTATGALHVFTQHMIYIYVYAYSFNQQLSRVLPDTPKRIFQWWTVLSYDAYGENFTYTTVTTTTTSTTTTTAGYGIKGCSTSDVVTHTAPTEREVLIDIDAAILVNAIECGCTSVVLRSCILAPAQSGGKSRDAWYIS